ncbi:hypothetical protein C9933_00305 [Methylophaga nitratireducenticrescens]|nr:hypothetical protein C9933_00305 [Methylophaga nitratireducenticrescens]
MRIITRRIGERLVIGDDIVIEVTGVKGNQVSIGIDAPADTRVDREEIRKRILAEQSHSKKHCIHGVTLYGTRCLACEREKAGTYNQAPSYRDYPNDGGAA